MARAFVSRNYAFIIQNAFYVTQTNDRAGQAGRTVNVLCLMEAPLAVNVDNV